MPNNENGASTVINGTLHNATDWQKPFGADNNLNKRLGFDMKHLQASSAQTGQKDPTVALPNNANGTSTNINGTLHNSTDWQKPFGVDNNQKVANEKFGIYNNNTQTNEKSFINYLEKKGIMNIGKDVAISSVEGAIAKKFVDTLPNTYKIGKIPAKNIGAAGNLTVKVGTTPTSTVVLKNVYKLGGTAAVAGVMYDVYVNYDNFGDDKGKFMQANLADGLKHGAAIGTGMLMGVAGAPVVIVAAFSVGAYYWVDANFTTPFKENLQKW